jgi:hypothetical protein
MRKLIFCLALLLVGCDDNGVGLVVSPDTGQDLIPDESDWTVRLTMPGSLNDVVWDGQVFIAVGDGGAVFTSVDGIDWVARESATDDGLSAIAAFGSDIYAVGGSAVLLSTDHGETWSVIGQDLPGNVVAANSTQVIAFGVVGDMFAPLIMSSEDRGETWQTIVISWWISDLIYRDGLFVAAAHTSPISGSIVPCVIVSTDGKQWNEILVGEEVAPLRAVFYADSQFFVAGDEGTVFSSFDAFNWTELSTPLEDVDYFGGAWNGTQLMLAGGVASDQNRQDGTYRPIGISSIDGGASWDIFGVDIGYESGALAWGNGRFVSVGTSVLTDEGAIYTTD